MLQKLRHPRQVAEVLGLDLPDYKVRECVHRVLLLEVRRKTLDPHPMSGCHRHR